MFIGVCVSGKHEASGTPWKLPLFDDDYVFPVMVLEMGSHAIPGFVYSCKQWYWEVRLCAIGQGYIVGSIGCDVYIGYAMQFWLSDVVFVLCDHVSFHGFSL
jgi:hypothetical protein